jgi:uncharacterized membrane protein YbhN (UPF0104 family)
MATEALPALRRRRGTPGAAARLRAKAWFPAARRALAVLFFVAVLGLVAHHARSVDWDAVWAAVRAYSPGTLLLALGFAAASHALYCCYDLIGRRETGHAVPARTVVAIGFTSYAFNLNLGSLVGGVALRYRLYARFGLDADTTTKVLALSLVTNWLGYCLVAGCVFVFAGVALPTGWEIGSEGLRWLGAALLVAAATYVGVCFALRRREWSVRGHLLRLPSGWTAALQLAISAANWMLIGGVMWVLVQHRAGYASVLGVLLIAAVAGVIAHVPAGLGVLEAVFIALLSHRVAQPELLAALLAYRAIYYLVPLALAIVVFVGLESAAKRRRARSEAAPRAVTA